jgi:hypothetical protein
MLAERQPVHRLIAGAARPRQVPAAVAGARGVTDEAPVRSEPVTHRAVRGRPDDPGAHGRLDEIADHGTTVVRGADERRPVTNSPVAGRTLRRNRISQRNRR